jgi:hypothetical protein
VKPCARPVIPAKAGIQLWALCPDRLVSLALKKDLAIADQQAAGAGAHD